MRLASFVALTGLLSAPGFGQALPTPTPGGLMPTITVEQGPAAKYREKFRAPLRCQEVPRHLWRPASRELLALVPKEASLAGAGAYLGAVFKDPKADGYVFRLFRGQKLVQELFLRPQRLELPFAAPPVVLSRDGQYLAFLSPRAFAVFAASTQVGLFEGPEVNAPQVAFASDQVLWCRHPSGLRERWPRESDAPIAVCYRAQLDTSSQEPIFRLEGQVRTLAPHDSPEDYAFAVAVRRDGKLWLVNKATADIILASASGAILRKTTLPFSLERHIEAIRQFEEQVVQPHMTQLLAPHLGDATKAHKPSVVQVKVSLPLVSEAKAVGNDLFLLIDTAWEPANAVFWVSGDLRQARCFTLDQLSETAPGAPYLERKKKLAVTDEALWLKEPLGYILWEELLHEPEPAPQRSPEVPEER